MAKFTSTYNRRTLFSLQDLDNEQAVLNKKTKNLEQNWWDFINPTQIALSIGAAAIQGGLFKRKKKQNAFTQSSEEINKKGFWNQFKKGVTNTASNTATLLQEATQKLKQADVRLANTSFFKKAGKAVVKWQLIGLGLVIGFAATRQGIKWLRSRQQKKQPPKQLL